MVHLRPTGGGSQAVEMKASDDFGTRGAFPGGFNGRNMSAGMTPPDGFGRQDAPMANTNTLAASQDEETEVKVKGLKSDGPITVLAGSFTLDCADDAVHAGSDITISGGQWQIRTADDGIHSDENVTIGGGSFEIPYCYEGVEGKNVTMDGGSLTITSNAELGDVLEAMDATLSGDPIEIAFNAKYITDVIRNISDEELCMKFNSNVSPCVVSPMEGDGYLYLILPVRVFS